jgi:hypothetical protein
MTRFSMYLTVSLGIVGAACGGHQSTSPTAPSAAVNAPTPAPGASGSATISGTVVGASGASGWAPRAAGMTVSVSGSSLTSPVDNSGRFALQGVPSGHIDLHFAGAGADAHLALENVAEREAIALVVHVSGSTAQLDQHERQTPDNRVEVEGRVTAVNLTARTLRIGDTEISVPAGTPIRHGSTSLDLSVIQVGSRIEVHGTRTGTVVTASEIEVENDLPANPGQPAPNPGNAQVELKGTISRNTGTCPALTFTVASTTVTTNASTQFKDTTCGALANGSRVEVKGTMQSNGSVLASVVEGEEEEDEIELKGTISGKTGSCPALTFTVSSTTVTTNASTQFKDTSCSALVNGSRVEVKGTKQSNGSVLASRVEGEEEEVQPAPAPGGNVEVSGTLSGKTGSCPALTFSVSSTSVVTNGSTQFKDTSCGALANGDKVEVKGTRQSNGTVLATRVERKH